MWIALNILVALLQFNEGGDNHTHQGSIFCLWSITKTCVWLLGPHNINKDQSVHALSDAVVDVWLRNLDTNFTATTSRSLVPFNSVTLEGFWGFDGAITLVMRRCWTELKLKILKSFWQETACDGSATSPEWKMIDPLKNFSLVNSIMACLVLWVDQKLRYKDNCKSILRDGQVFNDWQ